MKNIKLILKQTFCKHEDQEMKKVDTSKYMCISGEEIYIVCKKCRKVKDSYFREYEGMGYK